MMMSNGVDINIKFEGEFFQDLELLGLKNAIDETMNTGRNEAMEKSPLKSGNLRRSISKSTTRKELNTIKGEIFSKLDYAKRREFENKKNPHKKFYMKKGAEKMEKELPGILDRELNLIFNRRTNEL